MNYKNYLLTLCFVALFIGASALLRMTADMEDERRQYEADIKATRDTLDELRMDNEAIRKCIEEAANYKCNLPGCIEGMKMIERSAR